MLDVAVQADGWPATADWAALATRAVTEAVALSPHGALATGATVVEVAVRLADDAEVQALNAHYRGKDKPTNVLSFPMLSPDELADRSSLDAPGDDGEILLGDIILARETCAREAADKGVSVADHATHLVIHGTLHLLGYDHIDEGEALVMEELEVTVMRALGLADPYLLPDDRA
jgi:probable rRNA maturation factor